VQYAGISDGLGHALEARMGKNKQFIISALEPQNLETWLKRCAQVMSQDDGMVKIMPHHIVLH
jgi:hypothetical protein